VTAEIDAEIEKADHKLNDDPGLVPDGWMSYAVRPSEVEFWQGSPDCRHWRLSYHRVGDRWDRTQLWP
jgi:pyridoxamine 5'-phosphate oxidase